MTPRIPRSNLKSSVPGLLRRLSATRHTPAATYRLQFNHAFTFAAARTWLPYLRELGVSDIYASPYLRAAPGSLHGYDIIDHNALNPEVGSAEEHERFVEALHAEGLHQVLDIVPNHMGVGSGNEWWMDVLENGPSSQYAGFFDIDWHPPRPEMANRVLLPVLGDQFGRVLDRGELRLIFDDGAFTVQYFEHRFPIAPDTYTRILQPALDRAATVLPPDDESLLELQSIMTAIRNLPPRTEDDPDRLVELRRERLVIRRRLQGLCERQSAVCEAIEQTVREFNGDPGDAASFDQLAALLDEQAYRLSYWRVAAEEINYRRFFDINELAALRAERPEVFEATHRLVLRLLAEGKIDGLRIDHPDGLRDPEGYLNRLQSRYAVECALRDGGVVAETDGCQDDRRQLMAGELGDYIHRLLLDRPGAAAARPLYVVVEKILSQNERLPAEWPVDGTTGYDFLNQLNGIFVDAHNRKAFDSLYSSITGNRTGFRDLAYEAKKLIMRSVLASEMNVLALQLSRVAARSRWYRDFTLNLLTSALIEVIACFPIYRTYINPAERRVSERDRLYIDLAIQRAKRLNPVTDPSVYTFIQDTLTLATPNDGAEVDEAQADFVLKFQQVTGPVIAKGVEDTAFYRYTRLVSLNEVGGDPDQFGISLATFHRQNAERQARWPNSLLATSTHDTKRSEDVRARINALSELPVEWRATVRRWSRLNRKLRQSARGQPVPDPNDEYLLYQTLVGAWPLELLAGGDRHGYAGFRDRIQAYMEKAIREAKVHTSWINPNAAYEQGLRAFIAALFTDPQHSPFIDEALPFIRKVAAFGLYNSLSQTLLKLTSPGVPDVYGGTELWDFSLVDPDNRRPVDFERRARLLKELKRRLAGPGCDSAALMRELLESKEDGRIKLLVTHRALDLRARHPELFGAEGSYVPLEVTGSHAEHLVAFLRRNAENAALSVAPRLVTRGTRHGEPPLGPVWDDAGVLLRGEKPGQRYRDVFTGTVLTCQERDGSAFLPVAAVLAGLPVALLERLHD